MITINIVAFLAMMAAALSFGAWVSWHVYGVNADEAEHVRRFMRGADVSDEADMGEVR